MPIKLYLRNRHAHLTALAITGHPLGIWTSAGLTLGSAWAPVTTPSLFPSQRPTPPRLPAQTLAQALCLLLLPPFIALSPSPCLLSPLHSHLRVCPHLPHSSTFYSFPVPCSLALKAQLSPGSALPSPAPAAHPATHPLGPPPGASSHLPRVPGSPSCSKILLSSLCFLPTSVTFPPEFRL